MKTDSKKALVVKIIVAGALLVLVLTIVIILFLQSKGTVSKETVMQTNTITRQDIKHSFSITGIAESVAKSVVVSELSGIEVKDVHVKPGDTVRKGDILCTLDSSTYQKKLEQEQKNESKDKAKASAEIETANKNLEDAKTTRDIQNARAEADTKAALQKKQRSETDSQKAAEELAKTKQKQSEKENRISQLQQKLSNAEAETVRLEQQKTAKSNEIADLTRQKGDVENQLAQLGESEDDTKLSQKRSSLAAAIMSAQSEMDAIDAAFSQAQSIQQTYAGQKQTAEAELEAVKSDIATREAEYKSSLTEVEASNENYQKAVQIQSDTARNQEAAVRTSEESLESSKLNADNAGSSFIASMDDLKKQIEQCEIKADMNGTVTGINVKKGDAFKSGEVAVIQDLSAYKVTASVDQYDIAKVSEGMDAMISVDESGQETIRGKVTYVSQVSQAVEGSSTSASYSIEITLDNTSSKLRAGMRLKTELIIDEKTDCLAVPNDCIQTDINGDAYISVVGIDEKGKPLTSKIVVKKEIETDYYTGISAEGLEEGLEVLSEKQLNPYPEQEIIEQ